MQEILDRVESISEDQVLAMANQLFQPELVAVTLLGRLDGVKLNRNQLEC
jgi:predicted Zn-dependent peptidase